MTFTPHSRAGGSLVRAYARKTTSGAKGSQANGQSKRPHDDESLSPDKILKAFTSLPRVLRLVWDVQSIFTLLLALLYILQGFLPAVTAYVNALLLKDVVSAIGLHGLGGSTSIVIWVVIAQFGVQGISSLLSTLSNIVQQLLQERVAFAVQLQVMEKANTLDLAFFEDATFYDSLQQAQNEAASRPIGMISQTFSLGRTIITFLSMLFILTHLAWWLAILALLAPVPAFVANVRYGWWGYQLMRRQSPTRREMSYYTNLLTTDIYNKEIKLFTLGGFFINLYRTLANDFYNQSRALIVPRYLASFGLGTGSLIVNGVIYLYVALQAVQGHIDLLGLTLYTQAALALGASFQGILGGISDTYENNLFVNTLFNFLAYTPKIVSPPNGRQPDPNGLTIEFRHVSFSYPGSEPETLTDAATDTTSPNAATDTNDPNGPNGGASPNGKPSGGGKPSSGKRKGEALRDVSFTIHAGEAVALVGRNGAGKTTIVKLLTRLYDPDAGEILVNGHDIREYDLEALRAQIGVIFQDYVTYWLSASRNIGVGKIEQIDDDAGVRIAAAKSGADTVIAKLPDTYDTRLGKWFDQGQQLSGGEWQKVALARAFMRDAQLLILDEPTSALDPQAEYDVFRRFRELTSGKSAVFISHRFSTVRLANRIIVLENGRVLEEGSHTELLAHAGRYAELFNLQAEAYR